MSCLSRFTIHFRRPEKLKQNKNKPYQGEYGFDWLREEYIYPIDTVVYQDAGYYKEIKSEPKALLIKDPVKFLQEYNRGVENPITPYRQDYYPAWLSIFAYGVQGNANATIHKEGVYLNLQLDEIDDIKDDGTELIFKASKPCLKITPVKIPISEFIATPKKNRKLGYNGATINYYELENAVNISCQGDTLSKHEEIQVVAKLGDTETEVGKLMVYQNNDVPVANIVVVKVITCDGAGNKTVPDIHQSLEHLLKYQSFNQALIRAEISASEDFDLNEFKEDEEVNDLLETIKEGFMFDNDNFVKKLPNTLQRIYQKYGKNRPLGGIDIEDDEQKNTYLLFIDINLERGNRRGETVASEFYRGKVGNLCVIYTAGLHSDVTIVHEIGHSFQLKHIYIPITLLIFSIRDILITIWTVTHKLVVILISMKVKGIHFLNGSGILCVKIKV